MRQLLIALALPFAWSACDGSGSRDYTTSDDSDPIATASVADTAMTTSVDTLRDDMRQLWLDHVTWTRIYIIDRLASQPDTAHALGRLIQNQAEIADAIRPFYGDAAADHFQKLLDDHIRFAGELVVAAATGAKGDVRIKRDAWYANADDIARFLADANPNWSYSDLKAMMTMHLDQTLIEATTRIKGDWSGSIDAFDDVVDHALGMADVLTDGIAAQFPARVTMSAMTPREVTLHLMLRKLWQDHVMWTRFYLIEAIAGLPAAQETSLRLMQNQDDLGNVIRGFYGDVAGDYFTSLLRQHIAGAVAIVTASKDKSSKDLKAGIAGWEANGDQLAKFLAVSNPFWPRAEITTMMRLHLTQTLAEASARFNQRWDSDINAFDEIVMHMNALADTMTTGLLQEFPQQVSHGTVIHRPL